jgi:hypothetical protein
METFMTEHKDSQPKPASAEEIIGLADKYWALAYAEGKEGRNHDTPDGQGQATLSALRQAITQQAEALAQALAEVERITQDRDEWKEATVLANQRFKTAEAKLAALQYDGELPEPHDYIWNPDGTLNVGQERCVASQAGPCKGWEVYPIYTADQVRQAIAKAKQVPQGWRLVPVEPTQAMNDAGDAVRHGRVGSFVIYGQMIAAAPSPKDAL